MILIAASHKETFSIMHIAVSCAYFHAEAQRPVLARLPVEERVCEDDGQIGLWKKNMYGTRDAASNWECDWPEHVKNWGFRLGLSWKNLLHQEGHPVSGMTHGDDFMIKGPTERLKEFESKMEGVYIPSMQKSSVTDHQKASKH